MPVRRLAQQHLGRVCVVGLGKRHRGDEGAGLQVVRLLQQCVGRSGPVGSLVSCVEAVDNPELYAAAISAATPDTVLLVDAVHMSFPPGAAILLERSDLARWPAQEGHHAPPESFMRYLADQTNARVCLIGIEPADTDWGARTSPAVSRGIRTLAEDLKGLFSSS